MSSASPLTAGARIGDLVIETEIGAGAFGIVYRARDVVIGRHVALKVVRDLDEAAAPSAEQGEFLREARALGAFVHPNVATLYRIHPLDDGSWMLEMEYVEGASLESIFERSGRVPVAEAVALLRDLAAGLRAAHAVGVIHGDVKPANILRRKDGVAKLVDFGLARMLEGASRRTSKSKVVEGTPQYMAPEVISGEGHLPASDVWGLGAVLYRALTGRLPFGEAEIVPLFFQILEASPAPMPVDVPPGLARLVLQCLSKSPEARPALDDRFFDALDSRRRSPVAPEPERAAAPVVASLLGRGAECARLVEALDRVAHGRSELLAITGPAGIGKSRLAAFAEAVARTRGFDVASARTSAVEGVIRPLHRALVSESAGSSAVPTEELRGPGRAVRARAASPVDVERRLAARAAQSPVLVSVEGLHRAAAEDVRALGRLAAAMNDRPVLFLVTERVPDQDASADAPPKVEPLLGDGRERLDLGALPEDAVHAILEEASGEAWIGANVLERAVKRSGGNPLFALEILAHERVGRTATAPEGAPSRVSSSSSILSPPPALRDLLVRRLRGLPDDLREVLDVAAVDGFEFDAAAIAAVLDLPVLDVLRRLQRIARAQGIVVAREQGHHFAHPLMQEVMYAEVAPELRRELHRGLAAHLERRAESVDPERLGTHWERAAEPAKAMPWLLEAAHRAAMRLEHWRCVDLATRAGIVPGKLDASFVQSHVEILFLMALALGEIGRPADRDALYDDVERASGPGELLALRVAARRALSRLLSSGLDADDERRLFEAVEGLPDGVDLGVAHYAAGVLSKYRDDLGAALRHLRTAEAIYRAHGERGRLASVLDQLASVAGRQGAFAEAERGYSEAAQVCRESGRLANAEISGVNARLVRIDLGFLEGAAEHLTRAIRVMDADGLRGPAARTRVALARVRIAQDDPGEASTAVTRALAEATSASMWLARFEALDCLAEIAALRGDDRMANALDAQAISLAEGRGKRVSATEDLAASRTLRAALVGAPDLAMACADLAIAHGEAARNVAEVGSAAAAVAISAVLAGCPDLGRRAEALLRSRGLESSTTASVRVALAFSRVSRLGASSEAGELLAAADELERSDAGLYGHVCRPIASALARAAAARPLPRVPTRPSTDAGCYSALTRRCEDLVRRLLPPTE